VSDALVALGAALGAAAAVLGLLFDDDTTRLQDKIQRKAVEEWEKNGKEGDRPISANASQSAKMRRRIQRASVALVWVIAVIANVLALVLD
jgi:hypothetical protein